MTGDYTKVPLRDAERWTGARMQQGRVLLDHEWNLNLDAAARAAADAVRDVVGPSGGVPDGSPAFQVGFVQNPIPALRQVTVQAGRIWADGLCAFAPAPFSYFSQETPPGIPGVGRAVVFLDVFSEHVQPAEDWAEIADPALEPLDASARTRVGYRLRVVPTVAGSARAALDALAFPRLSTGRLSVTRADSEVTPDPCDPPGDPLGLLPDGMLRVEVLDGGTAATARFVWAADNGAATARVKAFSGTQVTLAAAPAVKFAQQDLVEVGRRSRRADRAPHGELYSIASVTPDVAGDVLVLNRPVSATGGATGLVVRRWDGQSVGAANQVTALVRGVDLGLRFSAGTGSYLSGDWWGARLRPASADGVERLSAAPPDGTPHTALPLALVDFDAQTVIEDGRPKFPQLTRLPRGTCTVTAFPGEDLQSAVDLLPSTGGELCLAAGRFVIDQPIRVTGRHRVVVTGVGSATVLAPTKDKCALFFEGCTEVEVSRLRAEGAPTTTEHLDGALTFTGCTKVRVRDCDVACADTAGDDRSAACLTFRGPFGAGVVPEVAFEDNRLEVGVRQIGILVLDANSALVSRNRIQYVPTSTPIRISPVVIASELARIAADPSATRYGLQLTQIRAGLQAEVAALMARTPGLTLGPARRSVASTRVNATPRERLHTLVAAGTAAQLGGALQGIVLAGHTLATARVTDNVVEGVAQGIHIGTARGPAAGQVMISGNVIQVGLPAVYNRARHAVFVADASRLAILGTVADLARRGALENSPTDAILVHGRRGARLVVRDSSLTRFTTGVRVVPLSERPALGNRLWRVSETAAEGATTALVAPDLALTEQERNVAMPLFQA
ncbi:DUF6519 domain-containing protein [Streptomyces sp. NBC_01381]|uniref:DUF6519 domain-containing protein n=1 Tax=Streptomyces sp. NBC_01381 TaxID=2903845 RepID=UPI00224F61A4|nr:DUF6519 domain-containing protein [Streptomyces sp. NBC_01381]MCX4672840.1 DUF6519 domain-containing protein [Streptomyces sp. NBC_01381]